MRTSAELSKLLLVASDQSYFTSDVEVRNRMLAPLPDRAAGSPPEYSLPAVYRDLPQFSITSGFKVVSVIDKSAQLGAKALIYLKEPTGEVIVAFGGTDGINAQDWTVNTQSAGWQQWKLLQPLILDEVATIEQQLTLRNHDGIRQLSFTGQSLGGALAQYAAADFFRDARFREFDGRNVALTTFNALGAVMALQSHGYSADIVSLNARLGQVAHYVTDTDIVSRLGGGHIGAEGRVIKFDWTYLDGPNRGRPLDFVDAHRIETAFYTHIVTGQEFAGGAEILEAARLIRTPGALAWAGALGNLLNNETVTPAEAALRLVAGLSSGVVLADSKEIDAVIQAVLDTRWRAGKLDNVTREVLASFNLGHVATRAIVGTGGVNLYLASLLGAVLVDVGSATTESFSKLSAWLGALTGRLNLNLPAPATSSSRSALARLSGSLVAEPETFKDAYQRAAAQGLKRRLRPQFTDREAEAIFKGGTRLPAGMLVTELSDDPDFVRLDGRSRAAVLIEAEGAYWSLVLAGARGDDVLLDQLMQERLSFWQSDMLPALVRLNPDYLSPSESSVSIAVPSLWSEQRGFVDVIVEGLRNSAEAVLNFLSGTAQAAAMEATYKRVAQQLHEVVQRIVIGPTGMDNPFDGLRSDTTSNPPTALLKEGQVKSFTVFVPYAAPVEGQHVSLQLQGNGVANISVLKESQAVQVGPDGRFRLFIEPGDRSVSFSLWTKEDVDADLTLTVRYFDRRAWYFHAQNRP